jgi:membrane-bound lytic murein transglycosylase B
MFVNPSIIGTGKDYLATYSALFDRIEQKYGVDREAIVAIWGVESHFGTIQGNFGIFRTLNTLFAAYPRREEFFRKELINFLILCRNNSMDPLSIQGSYAGAFGQAQFMPTSFLKYAQDFDGNQKQDLFHSLPDIFASIANYLHQFKWQLHSPVYAELGPSLQTTQMRVVCDQGRLGRISWRELRNAQNIDLPQPTNDTDQLAIIRLEQSPLVADPFRYVVGYPNFIAITEYNHSTKYAMAISELIDEFKQ